MNAFGYQFPTGVARITLGTCPQDPEWFTLEAEQKDGTWAFCDWHDSSRTLSNRARGSGAREVRHCYDLRFEV